MGFNSEYARPRLFLDVETSPHACAADFIDKPDFDNIQAAKNLRDPVKVAEDIARRKAEAQTEYESKLSRAALDWNVSRLVAIAWSEDGEKVEGMACVNEDAERLALAQFWQAARGKVLVGFAARTFDLPTLIQRSRLLDVPFIAVNLGRFGKGEVLDLRDVLTFEDARYEVLMPRSLKMFCRRFGLPVCDTTDGAEIPQLVADGRWDAVWDHVVSDVRLTAALAKRIGLFADAQAGVF